MTLGENLEQSFTHRLNLYVPARTLERLIGVKAGTNTELYGLSMVTHYGHGAAAAVIGVVMAWRGIRSPFADFMFVSMRLLIDQTLENSTGVGALPW